MLKGFEPGRLDELLTFESQVDSRNAINETISTWLTYAQKYGQRVWRENPERFEARQEVGSQEVQYMLRYDASITTTMRFKQDSEGEATYFYVRSIQQWRREGYTLITAERRDNQEEAAIVREHTNEFSLEFS